MVQLSPHTHPLEAVASCPGTGAQPVARRAPTAHSLLACYFEGWARADVEMIVAATGPFYRLHDPLLGSYDGRALAAYFKALKDRLWRAVAGTPPDLSFRLSGPTIAGPALEGPGSRRGRFRREAPGIGLAGSCEIEFSQHGVTSETIAWDVSTAADVERRDRPAQRSPDYAEVT